MAAMPDDFDDEPGDDGLRALVKMAREDFDEDPPARIDALLMAAARQHAPQPKAGVFERLRRWLAASMLSPALAGATALVVIGGTAGVLYMRNQGKVAQEPTVSRPEATAGRDVREETAPAPPTEFAAQLEKSGEPMAPIAAPKDPPPDPEPDPERGSEPKPRPRGGRDRGGADVVATSEGGPGTTIVDGLEDRRFAGGVATGGVATNMTGGAGVGEDDASVAQDSTRPPPPPDGDDESLDRETVTAKIAESGNTASTPSNRSQAENLHRQARTAARQNQCAPVKLMAQRAKKLDADYYASAFAKDPDIKPCL